MLFQELLGEWWLISNECIYKMASRWKHLHAVLIVIQLALFQHQRLPAAPLPINSLVVTLCCQLNIGLHLSEHTSEILSLYSSLWAPFKLLVCVSLGWADYIASHMLSSLLQDSNSCDFLNFNYWRCCQARLIAAVWMFLQNWMI